MLSMLLLNITSGSNSVCVYITPERERKRERSEGEWGTLKKFRREADTYGLMVLYQSGEEEGC